MQQTPRGAGPNDSPDDPESTKIGHGGSEIEQNSKNIVKKNAISAPGSPFGTIFGEEASIFDLKIALFGTRKIKMHEDF